MSDATARPGLPASYLASSAVVEPADAATLYLELAPAVRGYLRSAGALEPDDLLGEVFLQVARDVGRFRGDSAAQRRWVFTIAHNRLIDDRRRRERRPQIADTDLPDEPGAPMPERDLDPRLVLALAQLTDDQRMVITLRFVADLSIADVARITRRRQGAVKAQQQRALTRLANLLA